MWAVLQRGVVVAEAEGVTGGVEVDVEEKVGEAEELLPPALLSTLPLLRHQAHLLQSGHPALLATRVL